MKTASPLPAEQGKTPEAETPQDKTPQAGKKPADDEANKKIKKVTPTKTDMQEKVDNKEKNKAADNKKPVVNKTQDNKKAAGVVKESRPVGSKDKQPAEEKNKKQSDPKPKPVAAQSKLNPAPAPPPPVQRVMFLVIFLLKSKVNSFAEDSRVDVRKRAMIGIIYWLSCHSDLILSWLVYINHPHKE